MPAADIERMVRRWFVMAMLTQRYSGNPESNFDFDIRQVEARGIAAYTSAVTDAELSDGFWATLLPQQMETSSAGSPYYLVFQAAQVKMGDKGFLSRDITVQDLGRLDLRRKFIGVDEKGEDDSLLVAEQVSAALTLRGGGRGPERDGTSQSDL
jgi:hypothetical protein